MSIVPAEKIRNDPRNFAYLFPSMPLKKYADATNRWYLLKCIKALEDLAAINGQLLVPASCLHWQRKQKYGHRRVILLGRSYYALKKSEMTKTEKEKYQDHLADPPEDPT